MPPPTLTSTPVPSPDETADPYLWLEDVLGERALAWVRERNRAAEQRFADDPRFAPLQADLLRILDSRDRIAYVSRMGEHLLNFWRDAVHPRGLWRRTTLAEYRKAEPAWEVLLDLDALALSENENWVWAGADCLRPDEAGQPYRRCLVSLSRGGADAHVVREFDLQARAFVKQGFSLPEAKQQVGWKDADTLFVATDFGPGSMTTSGYPRTVKTWRRGTPLTEAESLFEGQATDVSVSAFSETESGRRRHWVRRSIAFWDSETFALRDGGRIRLDLPIDATVSFFKQWLLVSTRSPWTIGEQRYDAGALLAIDYNGFKAGARTFDVLYSPTERSTLKSFSSTRNALVLVELNNVRSRLWELRHTDTGWQRTAVTTPGNAQVEVIASDWAMDEYFTTLQDFSTPTTLQRREAGTTAVEPLKSLPRLFDAAGLVTTQFEAVSRDGTRIPYFVVMREGTPLDGRNPTLLYGYGGFEISQLPRYSPAIGKGWLEPGGVFVLANLRGGGEFGPQWHRAAQKAQKQNTWDDFAAVAEDLIRRRIASSDTLGIMGGSQGGLLVTATMMQRPELFAAVVSQVPLIDMLRFHKLLAGASWIAEYGDPDVPAEREFITKYSPYQQVLPATVVRYPKLFLVTSTRDDRVHPGHARKMAARMAELGHDVLYFENIEGGHGGAADNAQTARMWAQTYRFLWQVLGSQKREQAVSR